MNGIPDILERYGTSLAETRKLVGELAPAIAKRKKGFLKVPQFLTAEQAKEYGVELEEGWMLKLTPGRDGVEPSFSYITPEKWEITQDQMYISPEGQRFTREQIEAQLQGRREFERWVGKTPEEMAEERQLRIEQVFGKVFPQRDIEEVIAYAEAEPEAFYTDILEAGRTTETEKLLEMLGATEEQLEEFFAPMAPPPVKAPEYVTVLRFGFMGKPYEITWEVATMPDWAKVFSAGAGDMQVTYGGAARWLGEDEIGERLSSEGYSLQLIAEDIQTTGNWDLLFSPRFYAFKPKAEHGYQFLRALPFTLTLIPAGILGAYAGVYVGGAFALGALGKAILATLGMSIMATPLEAAGEAGGTYDEMIYKGFSPEEAKAGADSVFKKNMLLLGTSNWVAFMAAFAPMPLKVPANLILKGLVTTARVGGRVVITGLTEAGQEGIQEVFNMQALGEEITLTDEMKAAIVIGFGFGAGLGGAGDVVSSIVYRTKDNLTPDLKLQFDKTKETLQKVEGLSEKQADLKALDIIAETEEGAKIVTEATEAVKQSELLNQIKPKNEVEQIAWEHMFKDFPEAATLIETPMSLEGLKAIARLKGYTISTLTVPIAKMPSAKFRITGKGVRVYARDLAEVENFIRTGSLVIPKATLARMKAELAHALFEASEGRGYFKDVAGFRGVVEKMPEAELRDLHAMYVRVGKITEPRLIGGAYTSEEIMELEAELGGLREWISTEPARKLRNLIKKTGWHKGEVSDLTLRQYRDLAGKEPLASIIGTKKQIVTVPAHTSKEGKYIPEITKKVERRVVRWEYALDDVATEMGYASGEDLKYAIENVYEALARIETLEAELAKITPEVMAEAELQDNRERMLEAITKLRSDDEPMPRGTVKHPSHYKGMEDFTAEVNRELFYPIQESPLDISASAYWRTGDFVEYMRFMPDVSEMKLRALSDEVRANITELEELLAFSNKTIESLGVEISLEKPTSEKFKAGQKEIVQLENDTRFCEKLIKELKAGERLTIDDAVSLGIALRTTKGGNLVPAIRKSGFYVTNEFVESPHLENVGYRSGRWMDTMSLFEAIDGGRAGGTPAEPAVAQKYVLWPTERTYLARNKFVNSYQQLCQDMFKRFGLAGNKELILLSFDVIQQISATEANFKTADLVRKPEIKQLVSKYDKQTQSNIVEFAQWTRVFLDDLLRMQNEARTKRGQDPIEYRENYLAWVAETNIWSRFGLGRKTPQDILGKPPLPDYIKPDAPFNPRAMAREGGMRGYEMERDVHKLLFDYIRTAGKDIFYTNIIQNAKIHIAALRSMGYENSARLVEDWVSEAYAGVKPQLEKGVEGFVPGVVTRAAYAVRRNLTRAVFPLNWMWNVTIQPSSIAFTVGRYGALNTVRGLEYLFVPSARAEAREAYAWIVKSRRAGKMAYQDIGAQVEKNLKWEGSFIDKAENLANFITNTMESFLTGVSVRAAYHYGKSLGFTGRDLLEYASKGGAKTQSMYNYEDVPGVLRAKPVGTLFPFQTFCFQAFNYIREMNFIGRWKAGAYETISAKSAEGQATISRRLKLFVQFLVCIWLINMVVDKTTNRKPWILQSFIPFYSNMVLGTDATNPWNWPLPVQYVTEFWNAFQVAIKYEDFKKFRKWVIRYHMIGGTQINRMWDGIEAVIKGKVEDVRGTEMFEVYPEEWLKAVFMGPYQTEGGREFIDKLQEKKGEWYEYFKIPLPRRVSIKNEMNKNLAKLGQLDEEGEFGQIYNFGDFVSDLREIRRAVGDKRFDACDSPFVKAFLEAEESRGRYELYVLEHWDGLIPEEIREIGKEPAQGQRDEWRALHPEDDARLAMWGFGGRIQTQEAYDLVKGWCKELGIPMEHLSTWLPPEEIAGTYFNYIDAVNEFGGNSAEARLIRLEDNAFQVWGKEAYDWEDIEAHIEALRVSVKWREMDNQYEALASEDRPTFLEANPEYADDRRRRDAYSLGLSENLIEDYVGWYKTSRKGYADDWFLMEHKDFYNEMVKLEQLEERDFSKVPDIKWRGLWDKWVDLDEQYDALRGEAREAFRDANPEYHKVLRRRDAVVAGFSEDLIEICVDWYVNPRSGYEDDWFLMEHPEFYEKAKELLGWQERDFSKVPTREVYKLYEIYLGLPTGQPRFDYRAKHPALDDWLVLAKGYKPVGEKGEVREEIPWYEELEKRKREAERIKEWMERGTEGDLT